MLRSRDFKRRVVTVRVVEKNGVYVRSLCRGAVAANAHASFLLARCARSGCKWSETELALIYVRSLCQWAVAANAGVSFLLARCARGGCKGSETELALIYVRSLCRWVVAANAWVSFLLARCARGGCKPLGSCRERLWVFGWLAVLGAVANGRKRS